MIMQCEHCQSQDAMALLSHPFGAWLLFCPGFVAALAKGTTIVCKRRLVLHSGRSAPPEPLSWFLARRASQAMVFILGKRRNKVRGQERGSLRAGRITTRALLQDFDGEANHTCRPAPSRGGHAARWWCRPTRVEHLIRKQNQPSVVVRIDQCFLKEALTCTIQSLRRQGSRGIDEGTGVSWHPWPQRGEHPWNR